MSERFMKVVQEAQARIEETDVDEVKRRMDAGETFHMVDVREDREWDAGHIAGALHIGKGVIERDIESVVPQTDAEIILYCGGGLRSALAAETLQRMGYTHVKSMDGGFGGWAQAGYPVE